VLDRISAIEDMREAEIKSTGKVDEANAKYRDQVGDLKKTLKQMGFNRGEIGKLINKYEDIPGEVKTKVTITGDKPVGQKLALLSQVQNALKKGTALPAPARRMFAGYDKGGWTGPGATHDVAGVVHADEFVIREEVAAEDRAAGTPGLLDEMNETGAIPGYAGGGRVTWPFPTTAAMTRVPSAKEVANAVTPAVPSGGRRRQFIVRGGPGRRSPACNAISTFRPGARHLVRQRRYHSMGRAVDWPAEPAPRRVVEPALQGPTKEFISPWNSLNIHNGQRHTYTGAIYRQHNFAGGNAHDHIAMKNGGTIREPVIGVGASGRPTASGRTTSRSGSSRTTGPRAAGGGGGGAQINISSAGRSAPVRAGAVADRGVRQPETQGQGLRWPPPTGCTSTGTVTARSPRPPTTSPTGCWTTSAR
jgi:hypothetical protein